MTIVQGYKGSAHAPTSALASEVKKRGHRKEDVLAQRLNGVVIRGTQKPDIDAGQDRISLKGASTNIQLYLAKLAKSATLYGEESPLYQYQLAGYYHRQYKYQNNDLIDTDLLGMFIQSAYAAAKWLEDKNNFRFVIEKVFSDNYDANTLGVMLETDAPAYLYDMREVVDLYVNSDYQVSVTDGGKIVVRIGNYEVFYLEIRGGKDHCGSMNHGVRSVLYTFLQENLRCRVINPD